MWCEDVMKLVGLGEEGVTRICTMKYVTVPTRTPRTTWIPGRRHDRDLRPQDWPCRERKGKGCTRLIIMHNCLDHFIPGGIGYYYFESATSVIVLCRKTTTD